MIAFGSSLVKETNVLLRRWNGGLRLVARCALWWHLRGFWTPFLSYWEGFWGPADRAAVGRAHVLRSLRAARYGFPLGPLWLRATLQWCLRGARELRPLGVVLLKSLLAMVFVVLPCVYFVWTRGVLPVPSRITRQVTPASRVSPQGTRTHPYGNVGGSPLGAEDLPPPPGGAKVVPLAPPRSAVIVGSTGARLERWDGILVGSEPVILGAHAPPRSPGTLTLEAVLIPWGPGDGAQGRCRLEVRTRSAQLLVGATTTSAQEAPSATRLGSFNFLPKLSKPQPLRLSVGLPVPPGELWLHAFREDPGAPGGTARFVPWGALPARKWRPGECVFLASDPAFLTPAPPRANLMLIEVDGLRLATAGNPKLMPWVSSLGQAGWHQSPNHFVSLEEPGGLTLAHSRLPDVARELGYRTAVLGDLPWLSSGGKAPSYERQVGVQVPGYDLRQTTEEAKGFLEAAGAEPFFLHVRYPGFRTPARPPFEHLDFGRLLRHPLGWRAKALLVDSQASAIDEEIRLLAGALGKLGFAQGTDLLLTSSRGLQRDPSPWHLLTGEGDPLRGASGKPGLTHSPEDLRAPLMFLPAPGSWPLARPSGRPTTHRDLIRSLLGRWGQDVPQEVAQGALSLAPGGAGPLESFLLLPEELLVSRQRFPLEANLYGEEFPWFLHRRWWAPLQAFSRSNEWLARLPGPLLERAVEQGRTLYGWTETLEFRGSPPLRVVHPGLPPGGLILESAQPLRVPLRRSQLQSLEVHTLARVVACPHKEPLGACGLREYLGTSLCVFHPMPPPGEGEVTVRIALESTLPPGRSSP